MSTCYKNPTNQSCIDLILTNYSKNFKYIHSFEKGLSDIHKIVVTVIKTSYCKLEPKVINYKKYKDIFSKQFMEALMNELSKIITINENNEGFKSNFGALSRGFRQIRSQEAQIYPKKQYSF